MRPWCPASSPTSWRRMWQHGLRTSWLWQWRRRQRQQRRRRRRRRQRRPNSIALRRYDLRRIVLPQPRIARWRCARSLPRCGRPWRRLRRPQGWRRLVRMLPWGRAQSSDGSLPGFVPRRRRQRRRQIGWQLWLPRLRSSSGRRHLQGPPCRRLLCLRRRGLRRLRWPACVAVRRLGSPLPALALGLPLPPLPPPAPPLLRSLVGGGRRSALLAQEELFSGREEPRY